MLSCTAQQNVGLQPTPLPSAAVFVPTAESETPAYSILVDMAGRTIQIVNAQQQRMAMLQKSLQTLIMNASLGAGSEMTIDIAQGVGMPAACQLVSCRCQIHTLGRLAAAFVHTLGCLELPWPWSCLTVLIDFM